MQGAGQDVLLHPRCFRRGAPGYEAARKDTMWNARRPDRHPDLIVQARDVYDVVAALRLARREGCRVGVRSGGHSWAGNHVRDGGLLLDLSRLDEVRIDRAAKRACVGPGCAGDELLAGLLAKGLFFPVGHCKGVAVGGYLLQGGFGWNGRRLGPACLSVVGLDVVTADGEIVHASETENPDLYWAARGSGPGFFGVVVRFHLRLYEKPRTIGCALYRYPAERIEEVFRWAHAVGPEVPGSVELQLVLSRGRDSRPELTVFAPVFADGLGEALRALSFLNRGPLAGVASLRLPFIPATVGMMYRGVMSHYPEGRRYAVDNMWTRAPIDELLPGLRRIAATLPPAPSHMLWLNWSPPPERRPDMAFSMEAPTYLALYGCWREPAEDALYAAWAEERMREMQPLASGCQLADENLGRRPARFVADENLARLDRIRAARDPHSRFHTWMGRP